MDDISRTLGEHTAQLTGLKEATDKIAANVEMLVADKNQREGGRKTMYAIAAGIGTTAGAVGSVIAKLF